MLSDHEDAYERRLTEANRRFPQRCMCNDRGDCDYCRFIIAGAAEWGCVRSAQEVQEKSALSAQGDKFTFDIPIGDTAQVYELRRMFRLFEPKL